MCVSEGEEKERRGRGRGGEERVGWCFKGFLLSLAIGSFAHVKEVLVNSSSSSISCTTLIN